MPKQAPAERPEPREIELVDLSCQPNAVELKEDLRVNASFDELTAGSGPVRENPLCQARAQALARRRGCVISYIIPFVYCAQRGTQRGLFLGVGNMHRTACG